MQVCLPQWQYTGSSHHLSAPGVHTHVLPPLDPLLEPLLLVPPLLEPPNDPLLEPPNDPLLEPPNDPLVLLDVPPLDPLLEPSFVPPLAPPLVVPPLAPPLVVPPFATGLPSDVSPQLSPVDALVQGPHCENSPPRGRHLRMPSRHTD
jgi:hypothetical protein